DRLRANLAPAHGLVRRPNALPHGCDRRRPTRAPNREPSVGDASRIVKEPSSIPTAGTRPRNDGNFRGWRLSRWSTTVKSECGDLRRAPRAFMRALSRMKDWTLTERGHSAAILDDQLSWRDRALYVWLSEIGLTPAKRMSLGPLAVPDQCFADFFRGCNDVIAPW